MLKTILIHVERGQAMDTYILVLDHGTTGIKACLMNKLGQIVARGYQKIPQIYPQPSWVEQDASILWKLTLTAIDEAFSQGKTDWGHIQTIGLTNQRETVVLWDKTTGLPVYNAIVWQCRRTADWCTEHKKDISLVKDIQKRTGLVLDAYFSASKIQWLLRNCPETQPLLMKNQLLFGTVDTWILWKLSGGKSHATDYTNASRTMLFNIQAKTWDTELLRFFEVPENILPEVKKSSTSFGTTDPQITGGFEIPITSMIGDQQSALYGEKCWTPGSCKNTFGTGAFLVMNLGDQCLFSDKGLLTTLACDSHGNPVYALEGAIFIAGAALEWLKETLGIIQSFEEADQLALSLESNEGVYFVPAFVGLGAPYWESDARGLITGITQGTSKAHFARAALEAMAYQTQDIVSLMQDTSQLEINALKVDGGVNRSNFLMQFLADVLGTSVYRMTDSELTAKGAGFLAGLASGFWESPAQIEVFEEESQCFLPSLSIESRRLYIQGWQNSIQKTLFSEHSKSQEHIKV